MWPAPPAATPTSGPWKPVRPRRPGPPEWPLNDRYRPGSRRRARDDHEGHLLSDVVGIAVPGVEQVRAHRAWPLPLGTEHVVVDHQRRLIAEQAGEVARAVFGLETIVAGDRTTRGQRPAHRR